MRWSKTLRTAEAPTQKVYKKKPTIWWPIWGLATPKRQNTLRFKENFRNSRLPHLEGTKKATHVLCATRSQNRYLSAPLRQHETPRKQARNRSKGDLDAPRGPNPPSKKAKWDQIPFLQQMLYIYTYIPTMYVHLNRSLQSSSREQYRASQCPSSAGNWQLNSWEQYLTSMSWLCAHGFYHCLMSHLPLLHKSWVEHDDRLHMSPGHQSILTNTYKRRAIGNRAEHPCRDTMLIGLHAIATLASNEAKIRSHPAWADQTRIDPWETLILSPHCPNNRRRLQTCSDTSMSYQCDKWSFKRWGCQPIWWYLRMPFLWDSQVLFGP